MGRLSTHVLDTANGRPAAGMTIEFMEQVQGAWQLLKTVRTNSDGRADERGVAQRGPQGGAMRTGTWKLVSMAALTWRTTLCGRSTMAHCHRVS